MDPLEIAYRLKREGYTQTQIAQNLGVKQGVVSNVIRNKATAHSVATYIASLLNCQVEELWPDRYKYRPRARSMKLVSTQELSSKEKPTHTKETRT